MYSFEVFSPQSFSLKFIRNKIRKTNKEVAWLQRKDGAFPLPLLPCDFLVCFADLIPDELYIIASVKHRRSGKSKGAGHMYEQDQLNELFAKQHKSVKPNLKKRETFVVSGKLSVDLQEELKNMILLGFLDEPITEYHADKVDFTTNKLGGFPDWIGTKDVQKKVTCNVCDSVIPLLLQIYAPITERPQHHRTLYIFACISPHCWGNPKSWRCFKSQVEIEKKQPIVKNNLTFTLDDWSSSGNDWSCDGNTNSTSLWGNEAAAMINRVSVDEENGNELPEVAFIEAKPCIATAEIEPDENEPISLDSPVMPNCNLINLLKSKPPSPKLQNKNIHFIPWFLYAVEEKTDSDPLSEHVQTLLSEYAKKDNQISLKIMNNVNVAHQSDEKYEKSCPNHGDKLFHSFVSRIKANPEQILRYCRTDGKPLFLYEANVPTKCEHCHGDLIFEMQILPTLINYLELSEDNRNEHQYLEFGSAFLYTCKASCDKSHEENVIIQYEQF